MGSENTHVGIQFVLMLLGAVAGAAPAASEVAIALIEFGHDMT